MTIKEQITAIIDEVDDTLREQKDVAHGMESIRLDNARNALVVLEKLIEDRDKAMEGKILEFRHHLNNEGTIESEEWLEIYDLVFGIKG